MALKKGFRNVKVVKPNSIFLHSFSKTFWINIFATYCLIVFVMRVNSCFFNIFFQIVSNLFQFFYYGVSFVYIHIFVWSKAFCSCLFKAFNVSTYWTEKLSRNEMSKNATHLAILVAIFTIHTFPKLNKSNANKLHQLSLFQRFVYSFSLSEHLKLLC